MNWKIREFECILYVKDQELSAAFYQSILGREPELNVPGMTEFRMGEAGKLGLMPEQGMAKILGEQAFDPELSHRGPRCELYLLMDDPAGALENAIRSGGLLISPLQNRDWGHRVGYFYDPDGHVIAFAETI